MNRFGSKGVESGAARPLSLRAPGSWKQSGDDHSVGGEPALQGQSAIYKGDYSAEHPTVRMFWETFHEFPLEKKKRFLLFLTGSDRIPIYGMSSLHIIIQHTSSSEDFLPVAHTCYNLLDLPKYSSKEILRKRLTQAIDHYEGFSLA